MFHVEHLRVHREGLEPRVTGSRIRLPTTGLNLGAGRLEKIYPLLYNSASGVVARPWLPSKSQWLDLA